MLQRVGTFVKHNVDNLQLISKMNAAAGYQRPQLPVRSRLNALPRSKCLMVAVTTPVSPDFRPDVPRLIARARMLMEQGCDGIALFGTTGEGTEFSTSDRMAALDAVIAAGIDPGRIVVSVGAMAITDVVALSVHALGLGVHGLLLMPPCVYRNGITEEGTYRFYAGVIEQAARPDMRLYLYHFPDICGVPITPEVVRRLVERFPGVIAGVKDSGGNLDVTLDLIHRFPHLSIFTGTEIHLPEVLEAGSRGTICGLANLMPRLLRAMIDLPDAQGRGALAAHVAEGDAILSRHPFIAATKSAVAAAMDDSGWLRVLPPMSELPESERERVVADFRAWDARLPAVCRNL